MITLLTDWARPVPKHHFLQKTECADSQKGAPRTNGDVLAVPAVIRQQILDPGNSSKIVVGVSSWAGRDPDELILS